MSVRLFLCLALFAVTGCAGGFVMGCGSEPAQPARTIQVAANRGWQDTGITVSAGQTFQLRYRSGQITDKDVKIADAHGGDYVCGDPGCCEPLPDERRSSLVARVAGNAARLPAARSSCGSTIATTAAQTIRELSVEFIP